MEDAQPTAFDHGRPADPNVRTFGRDHDITRGKQHGVACKAVTVGDAHERNKSTEFCHVLKGFAVEARTTGGIGVARTSPAPFTVKNNWQSLIFRNFEHAVFLQVVVQALGSSKNAVVVCHDDGTCGMP